MATIKHQTLLDMIDLTGANPVLKSKLVQKNIVVHDVDAPTSSSNATTSNSNEVMTTLVDRRLKKCEICLEQFCKYTCPGCKIKTCCLSCAQKHKKITGCTGTRDRTAFVAKSKFDNFHLLNDYRFLEEANRVTDNAKRNSMDGVGKIPKKDQILLKNARRNGVQLFRMAKGMKRWKENRSYYNIKDQTFFWTMKLVFNDIKEEILTKQAETLTFKELLSKYICEENITVANNKKFRKYVNAFSDDQNIKIFFKNELDTGNSNLRYTELNYTSTIRDSLKEKSILEYPIFHIALTQDAKKYREEPFIHVPDKSDGEYSSSQEDDDDDDDDYELTQPAAKQRRITQK